MRDADLRRLARALHLRARPIGRDAWRVTGGRADHIATRHGCDCIDFTMRPRVRCKHLLAVALLQLDPDLLDGLRLLIPKGPLNTRAIVAPRSRPLSHST